MHEYYFVVSDDTNPVYATTSWHKAFHYDDQDGQIMPYIDSFAESGERIASYEYNHKLQEYIEV